MIPEISARPWNRPKDLSITLDYLLEHPKFKNHIDQNRIGTAGFSQGGITSIWLGGALACYASKKLAKQITVVDHPYYRKVLFKDIPTTRLDNVLKNFKENDFKEANQSYFDKRFKAVFAMAPGIDEKNYVFTKDGLSKVCVPTYIVIGEADTSLMNDAHFFAEHIPNCDLTILPGEITHMTLLNEGTEEGKQSNPEYVCDAPAINRADIHQKIGELAINFFNQHLYLT
jgi:predicted dienelactone hydrolase